MKNSDVLHEGFQNATKWEPLSIAAEKRDVVKVGKYLRMFIYFISLAGIALTINSCAAGYVATEPTYSEYSRPQRPSEFHVWIDGNWIFDRNTNVYVQRHGSWEKPHQNQTYIPGHWQKSPRGNYWVAGYWQKQGRQGNHHSH